MNKKSIVIFCLTALYSVLFFRQHIGVNLIVFTIATIGLSYYEAKAAFKNKSVILLSAAALFSACFAFIHNSNLSMLTTIVALLLIPGAVINKRSSIIIDLFTSLYTALVSPGYIISDIIEAGKNEKGKGKSFLRMLKYIVPVVFIITFFFIYRVMNPLFEKFTREIANIISIEWLFFTIGGLFLVYSFYKQRRNKKIDEWEKNWKLQLTKENQKEPKWSEGTAFLLLFIVLNIMLVVVNAMDVNYLYLGKGMPEGIDHKQFVHKGVGMLILSIILGIIILLYFFRGYLNFSTNKNVLKFFAYLWLFQNVFMVFSTGIRNTMYVDAALLTYKRIGVYFWLFFALLGLITLFIKLFKNKSVWYLARYNFTILYVVLLGSSVFDWDMVISNFNLKRAHQMEEISSLDKNYLLSISEGNIAGLFAIKDIEGFEVDSVYSYKGYRSYHVSNINGLHMKVYDFLKGQMKGDWRSYSLRRTKVMNDIQKLDQEGQLSNMELQSSYIKTLEPLKRLNNLKELNLNNNGFNRKEQLAGINDLTMIEKLYLNNNSIFDLDTLHENKHLVYLELRDNKLKKLRFIANFPHLNSLDISRNQLMSLASLPDHSLLSVLDLSGNPLNNVSALSLLPNLKELSLNDIANSVGKLPEMKSLEKLNISRSGQVIHFGVNQSLVYPKLKYLNIASNELKSLESILRRAEDQKSIAPQLTSLDVGYNKLSNLEGISNFKFLKQLNANSNTIYQIREIAQLHHLEELYLNNNKLTSIEPLRDLKHLKKLELADDFNISDFSPLSELSQLTHLNLSNTRLINIQYIHPEAPLMILNLQGCRIDNWNILKQFDQLSHLTVSYLTKEDVIFFKELKALNHLTVTNTEEEVVALLRGELKGVKVH